MAILPADQTIADDTGKVTQAWRRLFDLLAKPVAFSVHKNGTAQSGIVVSTQTKLTWSTEVFDLGGYFELSNSRWKPPAGVVSLQAAALFSAGVADTELYTVSIFKNGSILKSGASLSASGATAIAPSVSITDQTFGSDFYEAYCFGSGAGAKTVSGGATATYFMGSWRP